MSTEPEIINVETVVTARVRKDIAPGKSIDTTKQYRFSDLLTKDQLQALLLILDPAGGIMQEGTVDENPAIPPVQEETSPQN